LIAPYRLSHVSTNIPNVRRLQDVVAGEFKQVGDRLADAGIAEVADVEVLMSIGLGVLDHDALTGRCAMAIGIGIS